MDEVPYGARAVANRRGHRSAGGGGGLNGWRLRRRGRVRSRRRGGVRSRSRFARGAGGGEHRRRDVQASRHDGGARDPQVRDLLPMRGQGSDHGDGGGRAISRVLFTHRKRVDGHLSGMAVASHLKRPTHSSNDPGRVSLLTWPCSDWGLPCRACCQARGGLLPHRFTLTLDLQGGLFSVALSVALRRPGVTWQSALGSSDFPRRTDLAGMPRPSHPSATRYQRYRRWKGRGKAQVWIEWTP